MLSPPSESVKSPSYNPFNCIKENKLLFLINLIFIATIVVVGLGKLPTNVKLITTLTVGASLLLIDGVYYWRNKKPSEKAIDSQGSSTPAAPPQTALYVQMIETLGLQDLILHPSKLRNFSSKQDVRDSADKPRFCRIEDSLLFKVNLGRAGPKNDVYIKVSLNGSHYDLEGFQAGKGMSSTVLQDLELQERFPISHFQNHPDYQKLIATVRAGKKLDN